MKPIQLISQDLFDKVRSRFTNLEMGDETGAVTIDPAEARFFDFDFVNEGVDLGRVSISLNDLGSLKIYYSQGITENQDDQGTQMWYNFLKEMRLFAMRRLLRFDTRDIAKTNLDKNDFQHLAATQGPKEEPDMNTMNETKRGLQEGRDVIATGTPDAIKLKIKELGLGPARRESTGSGGEAIFVFRNPNYYVSQGQDGNWVLVQTNAESDQQGVAENTGREMTNTPRDRLISRMSPSVDNNALLQKVGKVVNSPEFNSDAILKIVDAGDTMTHPVGRYIQKEFDELQYDLGRAYEDHPEEVAEKLLAMLIDRTQQGVAEGKHTMNESRWNHKSSSKTSRAVQGKTEVVVRHVKKVAETYPGARSQSKNIKAIFIQNADGERAKYPFIHLAGAFAMAQHVDHGGVPHDPAGKAIIKMSENISKLGEFQRHIQLSSINADAHGIAERAIGHMNELKAKIAALGKRHHYEAWREDFEMSGMGDNTDEMVLDAVTLEDYKSKFTQTNFQEELVGFFPLLHSIMRETNTVDLEEYVSEKDVVEGSHEDQVSRLAAYNEKMAGENPPIDLGLREVGNWAKVGHHGDPIKTAWFNIARYGVRNNRFKDSVDQVMLAIGEFPDLEDEVYDMYDINQDEVDILYNAYETVYNQWEQLQGQQGVAEVTALQSLGGNPRFRQNLPMPPQPAIPKEKSAAESIDTFEEWADAKEKGGLTSDQMNNLKTAIEALPQGPQGPQLDAAIANDFFNDPEKGLTELPNFEELTQALQDEEVRDEEIRATPLQLFQSWAKEYNSDLLAALGMTGGEEPVPAPEAPPAPAAPPAPEQPVAEGKSSMVQEVAKIVKSFYNADNESVGPFRAEENIALDCKKQISEKFGEKAGEQAYEMAEAFINKLTQEWQQKHGKMQKHSPVDQGDGFSVDGLKEILSRIKGKVEGMGQPEMEEGSKQDFRTHGMDSKPSKENPAGNPPPLDWKVDPIQAATDRAHDFVKKKMSKENTELESIMKLAGLGEGSGPKEKRPFVDRSSPASKAKIQAARDKITKDEQSKPGKALADKIDKKK